MTDKQNPTAQREVMPLMKAAFRTTESDGQVMRYEMVFKFNSLAELHAANREWIDYERQALSATAESVAAAPGWKLVPIEPTLEMIEAGKHVKRLRLLDSVKAIQAGQDPDELIGKTAGAEYCAMLAVAPPAPAREPLDGWISVDQEMPEKNNVVLLAVGHDVVAGWLANVGGKYPFAFVDSDDLDSYDGDTMPINAWAQEKVTHWQPLPPAPKAAK